MQTASIFQLEKSRETGMLTMDPGNGGMIVGTLDTPFSGASGGPRSLDAGRHATGGHEPRQIRKEAAISDADCVVVRCRQMNLRGPFLVFPSAFCQSSFSGYRVC